LNRDPTKLRSGPVHGSTWRSPAGDRRDHLHHRGAPTRHPSLSHQQV